MEKVALYSFSGNYRSNGKWSEPEIGFRGEFIAHRDGRIFGYCDELYDTEEEFKKRFIAGRFLLDGISFFKLSNSRKIAPILYSSVNLDDKNEENALWAPVGLSMDFLSFLGMAAGCCTQDYEVLDDAQMAKLVVERIEYSEDKEAEINQRLEEFDTDYGINRRLRDRAEFCKFLKLSDDDEDEVREPEEEEEEEIPEEKEEAEAPNESNP